MQSLFRFVSLVFFCLFYVFLHIFLKISRLFNVIKMLLICSCNEKNVSQTVKCSLGQIIIYFFTICMKFFFGQMFANISCILLLYDFFANDSAEYCGCPFFYIFSRHNKHCRYFKWVTQFLIQKMMIMNPYHIRSTKSKSNQRKYCIETAKNSHTSKIFIKSMYLEN